MTFEDLRSVEEIYRFLRRWEGEFPSIPNELEIESLKISLARLATSPKVEIQKLSELSRQFHQALSVRELCNLIVPFERALHKSLRDDEFLVREGDQKEKTKASFPLVIILENFRSAFNVGAFFRMAEALGAQELILTGYTATPENDKIKKTTMGTEDWIPWRWVSTATEAIQQVKEQGLRVIAVETSHNAQPVTKDFEKIPTAFVFGNERFGINLLTLKTCDELRQIELNGQKNSLNVATCGAIVCHEWIRQWKK
jgi:23S rRNA (guanosine2251-2'-O)-methyltransferase